MLVKVACNGDKRMERAFNILFTFQNLLDISIPRGTSDCIRRFLIGIVCVIDIENGIGKVLDGNNFWVDFKNDAVISLEEFEVRIEVTFFKISSIDIERKFRGVDDFLKGVSKLRDVEIRLFLNPELGV